MRVSSEAPEYAEVYGPAESIEVRPGVNGVWFLCGWYKREPLMKDFRMPLG